MFAVGSPFVLGVNYWPRKSAMRMWKEFNIAEIDDDFCQIAALGMRLVRIFLLWEDFQPTRSTIACIDKLEDVADAALRHSLLLDVTFFTGHMSGPNWIPSWMLEKHLPMPTGVMQVISEGAIVNCGYRNPYVDEEVMLAEELLLKTVVSALCDHDGVGMWNLANEPDLVAVPSVAQARMWCERMTKTIKEIDSKRPVTVGLHAPSLREHVGFQVDVFDGLFDVGVMHAYPMYASGWATSPLDHCFVPSLCALTSAMNGGRPTLAEEFGGCTVEGESRVLRFSSYGSIRNQFMAGEEEFARYLERVLRGLVEAGSAGALLWCWADYAVDLYNLPPLVESVHERFFGIVRADGSVKPHGEVIKKFAQSCQVIQMPSAQRIDPQEYYSNVQNNSQTLIKQFYQPL